VIGVQTAVALLGMSACASPLPVASPARMSLLKTDWHLVTAFLDSSVAAGAAPGAVLAVSYGGERFVHGTGQLGADQPAPVGDTTVYDLASVTKVVGLTTALMFAVQDGLLDLDTPVQRYLPAFSGPDKDGITPRMLLTHSAGLPAWRPLFREVGTRPEAFALADSTPLEYSPGTRETYSDLGAIVLTQLVESIYRERIDSLLQRRLFQPLRMSSTAYLPPGSWRGRIAPTELDPWRGRVLQGEVHDENAAVMSGVSGHAGLFTSADDLLTFAEWLLDQARGPGTRAPGAGVGQTVIPTNARTQEGVVGARLPDRPTIRPVVLADFTRRQNLVPGSTRALGWDTPAPESSSGRFLSPSSFGHTGFTGTSLWIDPQHQLAIVLLSNRVNPTRDNPRWAPVRGRIADLVMTTLLGEAR
jgi:CubicO group peptidase (beta-lactamase class C family)